MNKQPFSAKHLALLSVLTALALALSFAERFIPLGLIIPLPGVKLGLANIVTVVILYRFGFKSAFAVAAVRCLLGSLLGGGLTALCFSLCGGLLSLLFMYLAARSRFFSVYGICVFGAAFHNIGQMLAAAVILNSGVFYYLPWLLAVSLVTGAVTGVVSGAVLKRSREAISEI